MGTRTLVRSRTGEVNSPSILTRTWNGALAHRDVVVKVKQDPEDESEWEGYTDPFPRDLPEGDDPIASVLSLERYAVRWQSDIWLIDKSNSVSLILA